MKTYSATLKAEKAKQNVTSFWLVKIGNYCYTDCPLPLDYDGDTYNTMPMRLSGFKASDGSTLDGGQIQLGNVSLEMSSLVLNNTLKNAAVYIREAFYDSNMQLIDTDLIAAGKVDGRPGLDEQWASITVAAFINPWTQRCPRTKITKKNFPFLPARGTKFTWGNTIITVK
jgi:hypothetical protein